MQAFNLPLNTVSFGQISTSIVRYLFEKKKDIYLFPIGNIDLSSVNLSSKDFDSWLTKGIMNAMETYDKKHPIFKLWHLNGSLESFSNCQTLLSFYELNKPTIPEINIIKNNNKVYFTSQYTVDIFKAYGASNVDYLPLFFDRYNFFNKEKTYFDDGRITFNLTGKLEKRKHHLKIIKAWAKKFGNNSKYFLQCSLFNPFLKQEDQNRLIASSLEGKMYFNIQFLNWMQSNDTYNDFLNSANIIIGMSGGEGWGLPEFHSTAIGKHAVILNAHGYKSWANKENSVLVDPNDKMVDAEDGIFFRKNMPYNQGEIFDFNEDDFISACEEVIKKVEKNKINEAGLKLQKDFSIDHFMNNLGKLE